MTATPQVTQYRVFLFSSDAGRLTLEGDFNTEEEAKACVESWIGDRDWDEELAAGNFEIQTRLNAHLKGQYSAYAHAYPILEKPVSVEGQTLEEFSELQRKYQTDIQVKSKPVIQHKLFPTLEQAEEAIDEAIDELAQELDIRLYGRVTRARRAAGIHERYLTDLTEFGYKVYRGDGPKFQYDESVTVDDLKAIRFPEPGIKLAKAKGFDVKSGALRVTDPCYSMDTWCAGTAKNVLNGRWLAHVGHYLEPTDSYLKERFEKEIAELEAPQERERIALLEKSLDELPEDQKAEHQEKLDKLLGFYRSHGLREFGRMWGNPDDWSGRVAFLHIRHESVVNERIDEMTFVACDEFQVGVDSGQAGFFDLAAFELVAAQKEHKGDTPEHEKFYEACGENTLGSEGWGVVQGMGAVSSSGYGDGGYKLLERRNEAGELIEARIVYMLEGSELYHTIGNDEEDEE
ncbi:hypothetical protein phiK7B1_119 [Pseudomonas phage phiK7B1]|nr:hypothetical protein phiK7B1_119 [Pseudomonas phage phiK7B1]